MFCSSISHSEFTAPALEARSPEAKRRKKLTGRDSSRIIMEASTAREVFVLIRSISSCCTTLSICPAKAEDTRKTPAPYSTFRFLPCSTLPVTRL